MRLIDADALLKVPNVRKVEEYHETGEFISYLAVPVEAIEEAPTIEAEPVRYGRWIRSQNGLYACSVCGVNDLFGLSSNCPNCRAKMYGGTNDGNADK